MGAVTEVTVLCKDTLSCTCMNTHSVLAVQLDWEEFVTVLIENTTGITVNASEVVIVQTPTYFTNLTDVFNAVNER